MKGTVVLWTEIVGAVTNTLIFEVLSQRLCFCKFKYDLSFVTPLLAVEKYPF